MAGISADTRQTLRQARIVAFQRVLLVAAGFLFVSLIPRTMGPDAYGRFALVQTMTLWFAALGGMGAVSMMSRFVPEFLLRGDTHGLKRLASGMLALRMANGAAGTLGYAALAAFWLADLDAVSWVLAAASVAVRMVGNLPFTLFLGLNQAARWEMGDLTRRLLGMVFIFAGYRFAGLPGACGGLLAGELAVLSLGLWWAREYLDLSLMRLDRAFLAPYLRFSAGFFASNFLVMLFHQGGAALVKTFSGAYAETGYYHLAFFLYITFANAAWSFLCAFGPLFSSLHARQETDGIRAWAERLLTVLGAGAVLALAMASTHGEMAVRLVAGPRYAPVAALLPWLGAAAVCFVPGGLARLLAVTYGKPQSTLVSAALQLAVFASVCWALVPTHGSLGGCYGVVLGCFAFAAYGTWRMQAELRYSLGGWARVVALGALCSPAIWAWSAGPTFRLVAFVLPFAGLLWAFRVLPFREMAELWRLLSRRER